MDIGGDHQVLRAFLIVQIDDASARRGVLADMLGGEAGGLFACSSLTGVVRRQSDRGVMLVHDCDDLVGPLIGRAEAGVPASPWSRWPWIAYSEGPAVNRIVKAMRAGAAGYLEWPFDLGTLKTELAHLECHAVFRPSGRRVREQARARLAGLTRRELEVLGGVSSGLSGREIGERLGISARTVEIHRSNFKRKLGMRSLSEVLRLAFEAELVPSPALWGPGRLAG